MRDLKPPWIRADLSGIADGTHTEHALVDLLEGFVQEAVDCNAKPHQIISALQHIHYELEHKRLSGKPLTSSNVIPLEEEKEDKLAIKAVASITPFPVAFASSK